MAFDEIAIGDPDDGGFEPPIDIWEDVEAVFVKVEVPGVRPEDLVVDCGDRRLTIRGVRHVERTSGACHRRERAYGPFCRSFSVPDIVDGASAVAVVADGVLTVRIPKRVRRAS